MQTFLPFPDFERSASVLDRQRLGKQRVEVLQILKALSGQSKGWKNHPATLMWKGCEPALILYGIYICDEWISRGYKDTCKEKILLFSATFNGRAVLPKWFGDGEFHRSHRSNLLRKNFAFYSQFFNEPIDLEYKWPH